MGLLSFVTLFVGLLSSFCNVKGQEHKNPPMTVESLDIMAYTGRWFVAYASQTLQNTIFKDGFCVVQDHILLYAHGAPNNQHLHAVNNAIPEGFIDLPTSFNIFISENLGSADGQLKTINAVATNMNFRNSPSKFVLKIGQTMTTHWILAVGPFEYGSDGQYAWAIVSDAVGSTLAVLARDMTSFQQYEQSVLDRVKTLGFTTPATKPYKIYQSETCMYPAMGGPMTAV